VISELAPPRIAAFTATATPEVRKDIAHQLGLDEARLHVRGFDRPNLRFEVRKVGGAADKTERLAELVRTRDGGVALVYAATRKNAEAYAAALKQAGMRARVARSAARVVAPVAIPSSMTMAVRPSIATGSRSPR